MIYSHDLLIIKLEKYGFRGVALKLLITLVCIKNRMTFCELILDLFLTLISNSFFQSRLVLFLFDFQIFSKK